MGVDRSAACVWLRSDNVRSGTYHITSHAVGRPELNDVIPAVFCIRWALLKGAKEVVAIDCVPARLKMAEEAAPGKVRTLNFKEVSNVAGTLNEWYPGGLDV